MVSKEISKVQDKARISTMCLVYGLGWRRTRSALTVNRSNSALLKPWKPVEKSFNESYSIARRIKNDKEQHVASGHRRLEVAKRTAHTGNEGLDNDGITRLACLCVHIPYQAVNSCHITVKGSIRLIDCC